MLSFCHFLLLMERRPQCRAYNGKARAHVPARHLDNGRAWREPPSCLPQEGLRAPPGHPWLSILRLGGNAGRERSTWIEAALEAA